MKLEEIEIEAKISNAKNAKVQLRLKIAKLEEEIERVKAHMKLQDKEILKLQGA